MLLRTHGGYTGWTDEQMLTSIPYSRFQQDTRLAADNAANALTEQYRTAAFVGWQNASVQGALKKGMNFETYLRSLGLAPKRVNAGGEIAAERIAAHERANAVRDAFRRKP